MVLRITVEHKDIQASKGYIGKHWVHWGTEKNLNRLRNKRGFRLWSSATAFAHKLAKQYASKGYHVTTDYFVD